MAQLLLVVYNNLIDQIVNKDYFHLLINQKFSCSYKDISDEKVEQLKRFILSISK